jgi:hypothetical protein
MFFESYHTRPLTNAPSRESKPEDHSLKQVSSQRRIRGRAPDV